MNTNGDSEKVLLSLIDPNTGFLTDYAHQDLKDNKITHFPYRDQETEEILQILIHEATRNELVSGASGVGKTVLLERLAQIIASQDHPLFQTELGKKELSNIAIIATSAGQISGIAKSNDNNAQMQAVNEFVSAIIDVQQKNKIRLVVAIDEAHTLSVAQRNALKTATESTRHPVSFLLFTTPEEKNAFNTDPAFLRRFETLDVAEFTPEQSIDVLKQSFLPKLKARYNLEFTDDALDAVIQVASLINPSERRPGSLKKVLDDIAAKHYSSSLGEAQTLGADHVYQFASKILKMPSNLANVKELNTYLDTLKVKMKAEIFGNDILVDELVESWGHVLTGDPRKPKAHFIIGSSSQELEHIIQVFVKHSQSSTEALLAIQGSDLGSGYADNTYFGTPKGVDTKNINPGQLHQFLRDGSRGKFGGVISIQQLDLVGKNAQEKFAAALSGRALESNDGSKSFFNRHLFIFTSLRGHKAIFNESAKIWTSSEVEDRLKRFSQEQRLSNITRKISENDKAEFSTDLMASVQYISLYAPSTIEDNISWIQYLTTEWNKRNRSLNGLNAVLSPELLQYLAQQYSSAPNAQLTIKRNIEKLLNQFSSTGFLALEKKSNENIELQLDNSDKQQPVIRFAVNEQNLSIAAPKTYVYNPLRNQDLKTKLLNLKANLSAQIFGQSTAIEVLYKSIAAQLLSPNRSKAASILLLGPTGAGKSELSKVLYKSLFEQNGGPTRVDMGEMQSAKQMQDSFIPKFEKYLLENQNGGVLLLDELSNLGGGANDSKKLTMADALALERGEYNKATNPQAARKAELSKFLYPILDETYYTDSLGNVHDLRKHIIIATGNDAQEFLFGETHFQKRMHIYEFIRRPIFLKLYLRQVSGLPEALIGRIGDIVYTAPQSKDGKAAIANKFLNNERTSQALANNIEITYTPKFVAQLGEVFYTDNEGGRSIEKLVSKDISSTILGMLINSPIEFNPDAKSKHSFELSIQDNFKSQIVPNAQTFKRKIVVVIKHKVDAKLVQTNKLDLSDKASPVAVISNENARSNSIYVASMAILLMAKAPEINISYLSLLQANSERGDFSIANNRFNKNQKLTLIQAYLSGLAALELSNLEADSNWSYYLSQARQLAQEYVIENATHSDYMFARKNADEVLQLSQASSVKLQKETTELLSKQMQTASVFAQNNYAQIQKLAAQLLSKQHLNNKSILNWAKSNPWTNEIKVNERLKCSTVFGNKK